MTSIQARSQQSLRERVEELMRLLPCGHVTTYGDLAAMAGSPLASRIVGGIAHYGDPGLPWHRVVNRRGGLARGYPGGPDVQRQLLEQDGIAVVDATIVDFERLRWRPL